MKGLVILTLLILVIFSKIVSAQSELVGYWKFDEFSGQIAIDSSGNNNNGNIINLGTGINWDTGKYNNSLKFYGTNGYVNVPNSSSLDFSKTNSSTISFWLKLDSENRQDIIGSGWWWNKDGFDIEYGVSTGYLALRGCFDGNDIGDHQYFYYKPFLGLWTNIAFVFDKNVTKLYVNGNKVVEKNLGVLCFNKNKAVKIGGTHYYLNGSLDEVKIYLRALSEEEIREEHPSINDNEKLSFSFGNLTDTISYENIDYNERNYKISLEAYPEVSSTNITVCSNVFNLIKIPDAIPEGPQNIPDINYWDVKFFKNGLDDTSNWVVNNMGIACRDDIFSSVFYNVVAKINPEIKIITNYNQFKTISNMSYGVQVYRTSEWLDGGTDQALWKFVKRLNLSTIRFFDGSLPWPCSYWDSITHSCNSWNWTEPDRMVKVAIDLGIKPMMSFWVDFDKFTSQPGMILQWNGTAYPNPEDWANYVSEFVKHYNVNPYQYNITHWEIMNEPPIYHTTEENHTAFVKVYNMTRQKIKAVDPNALTGINYMDYKKFYDVVINSSDDVDFATIHPYMGNTGTNSGSSSFVPPNDTNSYYTDSTLIKRASESGGTGAGRYTLEQMRNMWWQRRGKYLEVFNSESDLNACGPIYNCDPRQTGIFGALWYAALSKSLILNGSTYTVYFKLQTSAYTGNVFGVFGHGLFRKTYPFTPFANYWTNYLLTNFVPNGSKIYDSNSNYPTIVDALAVETPMSKNILLINKVNVSTDVRIPMLGFGVKNATLYLLDQNSYKWYYDYSIKDVVITSNISTIKLDENNVQNIKFNGYSVGILQAFTDPSIPYIKSVTSDLLSSFYNYSENKNHIQLDCTGTNLMEVNSNKKPEEIRLKGEVIEYDDLLSASKSWKYDETNKTITIKFIC